MSLRHLKDLQPFHTRKQQRILCSRWVIRNSAAAERTGQSSRLRASKSGAVLFGYVATLPPKTPALRVLEVAAEISRGVRPSATWKRPGGGPRDSWVKQIAPNGQRSE